MQKSQVKKKPSKEMRKLLWRRRLCVSVAVLVAGVGMLLLARSIWQATHDQAQFRHARDLITEASELEPHFAHTDGVYYNSVEDTAELLRQFDTKSLVRWAGFWGVVLEDGEVVLNRYHGSVGFKEGCPVLVEVVPGDCDAMILEGLDLPQSWRGRTITIMQESEDALVHFVAVTKSTGSYTGAAPDQYYGEMWVWTGEQYEFGLDAVPDEVRRQDSNFETSSTV